MKNKFLLIFIILIVITGIGIGIYYFTNNKSNKNSNSIKENISTNYNSDRISSNTKENALNIDMSQEKFIEEEIGKFSTKIYTNDPARQNNINITCSILNDKIIDIGSTFSFCETVGKASTEKGYQEADIFDQHGNKIKGLGGGNCQISTTLYNAVLTVPNLVVTEKHEHSNKVPYIETGKDAAVAYGSYDFKFKNESGYKIKIKANSTPDSVNVILYRISTTY